MGEIAVIRTSDRGQFKRCRRKWAWTSNLRQNRTLTGFAAYLWIGTGCHYALEDYHGYNYYKHPVEAFRAYVEACRKAESRSRIELPDDLEEQITLGEGLLEYYLIWLKHREPLETLWIDGVPQVEVKASIELPIESEHYDKVIYQVTLDRVVVIDGEYWVLDYKFYNRDWTPNPIFDSQMSAYIWAGHVIYEKPVVGAILQKHFKKLPKEPRILSTGKISSAEDQDTTYHMYRDALIAMYGKVEKAPLKNRKCLELLMEQEGDERDKFIQRQRTKRNEHHVAATGTQIMMELEDMLNPDLPLYKNDTKDCSWDCGLSDICLMMDEGDDWEQVLLDTTVSRSEGDDSWRQHLPHLSRQQEQL